MQRPLDCHGRIGLQKGIRKKGEGTNRRLVQVWNTKRSIKRHSSGCIWGRNFSATYVNDCPRFFFAVVRWMSKKLVNRKRGERKSERFGNEPTCCRRQEDCGFIIDISHFSHYLFSLIFPPLHRRLGVQFAYVCYSNNFSKKREKYTCYYMQCVYIFNILNRIREIFKVIRLSERISNFYIRIFNFYRLTLFSIDVSR